MLELIFSVPVVEYKTVSARLFIGVCAPKHVYPALD